MSKFIIGVMIQYAAVILQPIQYGPQSDSTEASGGNVLGLGYMCVCVISCCVL